MFLGDKGKPRKYGSLRLNYDILIDNERFILQKLSRNLGFFTILFEEKIKEVETVFDTDRFLFTGSGLILRKMNNPKRTYYSLVRISDISNSENREKKSFLGECEPKDLPTDFPEQIANAINIPILAVITCVVVIAVCKVVTNFSGNILNAFNNINPPAITITFDTIPTIPAKK